MRKNIGHDKKYHQPEQLHYKQLAENNARLVLHLFDKLIDLHIESGNKLAVCEVNKCKGGFNSLMEKYNSKQ